MQTARGRRHSLGASDSLSEQGADHDNHDPDDPPRDWYRCDPGAHVPGRAGEAPGVSRARTAPSSTVVTLSPDRADHIGAVAPVTPTPLAPDRVDKIGTDQQPIPPVTRVVVRTTNGGFDWTDAAIGAGSVLTLVLIASAAMVARGRRREPLSA